MKKITNKKLKRIIFGNNLTDGLIYKVFIYSLLIAIGYIYLFPLLNIFSNSLKDLDDLLSPMVLWIPTKFYFQNYLMAYKSLNYLPTMFTSLLVTLIPAIIQTAICSFIGYGFAKFKFRGKKLLLALVLIAYIIPPQITMIPKYILFSDLNLVGSPLTIIIPSLLGQGLYSSIFIFIFYQFFKMLPKSLDEAALVDGASRYYIFYKIAVPLSIPAYISAFLFSFVWYWNETYISSIFLGSSSTTLQLNLIAFDASFNQLAQNQGFTSLNEAIKNAGTILVILPLLIIYLVLQRHFVTSIDNTGLAGGE